VIYKITGFPKVNKSKSKTGITFFQVAVHGLKEINQAVSSGGGLHISKLLRIYAVIIVRVSPVKDKIFTDEAGDGLDGDMSEVIKGLWTGNFRDGGDIRCFLVDEA